MSSDSRLRVLIIDDNAAQCIGLAELLHLSGFTTFTALDGPRGLYLTRTLRPDVVLLDMNMPGMDGIEVCREIRMSPETANTAIVFHSAAEKPVHLDGADSFVTYPVPLDILCSVLRGCAERRMQTRPQAVRPQPYYTETYAA